VLVRGSWAIPPIFTEIRRLGMVADDEMVRVFNLGLGMVVAVSEDTVDVAVAALAGAGIEPAVVGWVEAGERGVELTGPPLWPSTT
jgi:phosphoribosylformylglycinamidine cyclo-ligase